MNPGCEKCKYKDMNPHKEPCVNCWVFDERPNFEQRPTTNYDCLVSKTPEELAKWLRNVITECSRCPCNETPGLCEKPCKECLFDWLKSPAEVEE